MYNKTIQVYLNTIENKLTFFVVVIIIMVTSGSLNNLLFFFFKKIPTNLYCCRLRTTASNMILR